MDTGALHTDTLAVQTGEVITNLSSTFHYQPGGALIVLVGKVDRFLALFGDRHRRQNGIDFFDFQRGNQAVVLLLDPLAFDLHFCTERIADIVIKTSDFAVGSLGSEGRISCFDADFQWLICCVGH
ncbi:hypothetical protein D3C87_1651960 [compost metagenome]